MTIKLPLATILAALALRLVGPSSFSRLQALQAHSLASYIEAVSTADGLILEATNAARSERGGMRRALRGAAPGDQDALAEIAENRATFDATMPGVIEGIAGAPVADRDRKSTRLNSSH